MIIGNGLLATVFKHFAQDDSVIIFASGVSNSKETSTAAFEREKKLLQNSITPDAKLVYFSTCSVFDKSLKNSPYIIHKKEIETYIRQQIKKYLILRLPIVVGHTPNPNTLTNYLFHHVAHQTKFTAYAKASRYLIDIEDVAKVTSFILNHNTFNNDTLDIVLGEPIQVLDLICIFEQVLKVKATYDLVNSGSFYPVDNTKITPLLKQLGLYNKNKYYIQVIEKYYKK